MADLPPRQLAYPLRLDGGDLAVVEQDTIEEVRQSVFTLVRTPIGARPLAPGVGVDDPTFSEGVDPDELAALLMDDETGEPRAEVTVTAEPIDGTGEQQIRVEVALAGDEPEDEEI